MSEESEMPADSRRIHSGRRQKGEDVPVGPVVNNSVETLQKREVERQAVPYRDLVSQILVYACNTRDNRTLTIDFTFLAADYPQYTSLIWHLLVGISQFGYTASLQSCTDNCGKSKVSE